MRMVKKVCSGMVVSAVMASLTTVSAEELQLAANSGELDLSAGASWKGGALPTIDDDIFISGYTGVLSLSEGLTVTGRVTFANSCNAVANFNGNALCGKIAVGDGTSDNRLDLVSGEIMGKNLFLVGSAGGSRNFLCVSNEGTTVSAAGTSLKVGSGSASADNVLVVTDGAGVSVSGTYSCLESGSYGSGNLVVLDGAGSVDVNYFGYIGREAGSCNNRMIVRDVASAKFKAGIVVGNEVGACGNTLLITNTPNLEMPKLYIGNKGACNTGEVYLTSGQALDNTYFHVGTYSTATNCRLMVDGAGNSYSWGNAFSRFSLQKAGNTIELRNITLESTDGQYYPNIGTNSHYVIGKGAKVTSTFTSYPPFNLRGAPGSGITVDEGEFLLPHANGGIKLGENGTNGCDNVFSVRNGGRVGCSTYFRIGADGCRLDVRSGGELLCTNLLCEANDCRIAVSDATIDADIIDMPRNQSDYTGWATNNIVRLCGTSPRFYARRYIRNLVMNEAAIDSEENKTGVVFEFVLPENGYETVPVEAGHTIWLRGKYSRMRVDASAYKGDRDWMTVMRAPTLSIAVSSMFYSELPQTSELTVEHRVVTVNDVKELQIRVIKHKGFVLVVK